MTIGDAGQKAEMPDTHPKGSGRNPREYGRGASNVTAEKGTSRPEALQLMEAAVDRENMMAALRRVEGNKGSAGIDGMSVDELRPFLKRHWPQVKKELLEGEYEPSPVRKVEIPKP